MASNRPYYLYRMLRSLLSADGVNKSMISVFIDGFYDEPLMVSRLFNLRAIQQRPLGMRSARISHHYKSSLTATFELFPEAQHAIIFEEDLDVARDALVFFNQTLAVLEADPSLYCASAWNDQGYEHTAADSSLLYRIETMPGLGWLLSRRLYKEELEPQWPAPDKPHDWDMWIRTEAVRKGRECIIPDVSRTFHFGSTGTNINSYFQKQYFSKHAFSLSVEKQISFAHLDEMSAASYERLVEKLVSEAHVVGLNWSQATLENETESSRKLCDMANNIDRHLLASARLSASGDAQAERQQHQQVIFIEMIDEHDFGNWLRLAKCWNIWDLDARGQHKSMWRLFVGGRPTLVVGAPASPYARLKPKQLPPFRLI